MAARRRHVRWWLGLLVGAGIGLALWQADAMFNGIGAPSIVRGLSVDEFAMLARAGDEGSPGARLENVVVHPPLDGRQRVTAFLLGAGRTRAVECTLPMPMVLAPPPRSATTQPVTYASARAFLGQAAPTLPYRYAWWERSDLRAAALIGTPAIALGGLLPLTLWVLVRAGLIAPPPQPEPEPEAEPEVPAPSPAVVAATAVAPAATQEEPPPAPPAGDPTSYEGGVYYPVHIPKPGERDASTPSSP